MRRKAFLALETLGAQAQEFYFPKGTFSDDPGWDLFTAVWYSTHLKALNEPSLLHLSSKPSYESYRFVWLRTFRHPVTVRLDITVDGIGELTTKVSDGLGGYMPGEIIENFSRRLTRERTSLFLAGVEKNKFWELPSYDNSGPLGLDGSQWIIEGVKDGKYHVVDQWTPKTGPIRELGLELALGLAELKIPKHELY
jgi:hypothetical protein